MKTIRIAALSAAALAGCLTLLSIRATAQSGCANPVAISPASSLRFGNAPQQFVLYINPNGAGFSCNWYTGTTSDSDWLTGPVTYFAPGGNGLFGEVTISVTENTTGMARTGHIDLNAQAGRITVVQEPNACVSVPPAVVIPRAGGAVNVPVQTSAPDCAWAITNHRPFFDWFVLSVSSASPGEWRPQAVGSRTLTVTAQSNANGTGARTHGLIVAGAVPLQLNQEPPLCVFALAPATVTVPAGGASGTLSLTGSGSDCSYTAAISGQVPINVSAGASGAAPATIAWSVPASTDNASRTGALTVGGATAQFTQSAPAIATDLGNRTGVGLALWRGTTPATPTPPAPVRLVNTSTPAGGWTATADQSWVSLSAASGVTPATLQIGLDTAAAAALPLGVHRATVSVVSATPAEGTRRIAVALFVADASNSSPPRTMLQFPPGVSGSVQSGAVPLTGWALADIGIDRIEIWRNPVSGEPGGEVFIGNAVRVPGARPDVAIIRAGRAGADTWPYPGAESAGWGYMLLSNALPGAGNGTFTFHFDLIDLGGRRTRMGSAPLTFDNISATKPFGTIDVPAQGETVTGTIVNRGWVLTPQTKTIPQDGSTIKVYIDGVLLAPVTSYHQARPDVKALFPGLRNSDGPGAQLTIDTTTLSDGLHTIAWGVIDDAGVAEGIGSRHFTVQNGSSSLVLTPEDRSRSAKTVAQLPVLRTDVWSREGVDEIGWATRVEVDAKGHRTLRVGAGQRVELFLDPTLAAPCGTYEGHVLNGEVAGPLPAGSSLDARNGIFRWQPLAAFSGTFDFVFVQRGCDARERRIPVKVVVGGK